MTREEFIKKVEELDRVLMEEVETEEMIDETRADVHYGLEAIIDLLENFY